MRNTITSIALGVCLGAIALLSSCGNNAEESTMDYSTAIIIDVRATDEFAAGHLEGAINYNVEDGTLEQALPNLDPKADYVVYCRSGRRSAIAVDLMKENGFAQIANLGSLQDAADATGLTIVTS
jgi:rhodanese-related sulfurtransferase